MRSLVPDQHHNTGKTPNTSHFFSCQTPRPIVSDPSFPSIITSQTILSPFKWQVDRGLMRRRRRFTTSRLITKEAATSEHCVESRRHTRERKCSLSCHHQSRPRPPSPSHPQQKQSPSGSVVGDPGPREETRRLRDTMMSHTCHHTCSSCLCNTMLDVLLCN